MALLTVQDIGKSFGGRPVLEGVSFSLDEGGILCLLGPSGCGKTTLLRIIAGLERPDTGKVVFAGQDMAAVPPHLRAFGMMFQEYALFPHRDVSGNIAFGLRMQNLPGELVARRTREMIEMVGLSGYEHRNVGELSGGERQRVALARTLAPRPRLLLLDEPLGSLDRALRERLMLELKSILKTVSVTSVFVTHDQAEAFAVADSIALLMEGHVEQIDSPERIYRHPASATAARFIGLRNLIDGRIAPSGGIETEFGLIRTPVLPGDASGTVTILIQPDAARPCAPGDDEKAGGPVIQGTVVNMLFRGRGYTLEVRTIHGTNLLFDLAGPLPDLAVGGGVRLLVDPAGISVLGSGPSVY
ncbi:MAG TPA: ABC transporter ATP-binding protein [Deltaproteobacteria bacterium]|nr:ABC transporter ATP-binding protein [Deltaproteobacteria bacterium]